MLIGWFCAALPLAEAMTYGDQHTPALQTKYLTPACVAILQYRNTNIIIYITKNLPLLMEHASIVQKNERMHHSNSKLITLKLIL